MPQLPYQHPRGVSLSQAVGRRLCHRRRLLHPVELPSCWRLRRGLG